MRNHSHCRHPGEPSRACTETINPLAGLHGCRPVAGRTVGKGRAEKPHQCAAVRRFRQDLEISWSRIPALFRRPVDPATTSAGAQIGVDPARQPLPWVSARGTRLPLSSVVLLNDFCKQLG